MSLDSIISQLEKETILTYDLMQDLKLEKKFTEYILAKAQLQVLDKYYTMFLQLKLES